MARPRKSVNSLQGNYSQKEIKERLKKEKAITGSSDNIVPPIFIQDDMVALAEFYRVVDELLKVDIATNIDATNLGLYCKEYSSYYVATQMLNDEGYILLHTNKAGAENTKKNEWYSIQQTALNNMLKLSSLYGFDPSSRAKIAHLQPSEKEKEENPLVALARKMNKINESG